MWANLDANSWTLNGQGPSLRSYTSNTSHERENLMVGNDY